tara:strand:- start:539 stop:823 length:285 start_codon:yes stop_codon:yes gene_type:complete
MLSSTINFTKSIFLLSTCQAIFAVANEDIRGDLLAMVETDDMLGMLTPLQRSFDWDGLTTTLPNSLEIDIFPRPLMVDTVFKAAEVHKGKNVLL